MNDGEATSLEKGVNGHLFRCGASASCLVFGGLILGLGRDIHDYLRPTPCGALRRLWSGTSY
jgi:hypothetical protein